MRFQTSTDGTTLRTRYAPAWVSDDQAPTQVWSQIAPGLFQGGTPDDEWVAAPATLDHHADPRPFDAVVTLFSWAQPFGWGVEELRYGFADAHPAHADMGRVVAAARWAHRRWQAGDQVLIRCQAGLNRSGLVTALVLMLDGMTAAEAISTIRARRSEVALCNDEFVDWLHDEAAEWLQPSRSGSSQSAA